MNTLINSNFMDLTEPPATIL